MPSPLKQTIVFLDAATLDFGDLPLTAFRKLGRYIEHPHTSEAQLESRLRAAEMIIINKCHIGREVMEKAPRLKAIHVSATGVNNVDLEAARSRGIAVTNVKGYSTDTVAQFTFSFLLALAGNLIPYHEAVRQRKWCQSRFFMLPTFPVMEIRNKVLGIIGYGDIGRRVSAIAEVFGMKVLIGRIPGRKYTLAEEKRRVPLAGLYKACDFISVHAPLTPLTRGLIDADAIGRMKKTAFLINVARGGIINEKALFRALKQKRIAGAATDVLSQEPPPKDHPLIGAPGMIMTPHMAWASIEARRRLVKEVYSNIRAFQAGKKRNRVV